MRQFRRKPGYCCCDNSAVFLPVGQVGRYWFQASCMLRWFAATVEQKKLIIGFCAVTQGLEWHSQNATTNCNFRASVMLFLLLSFCYQHFAVLEEHPWNYTAAFLPPFFLLETSSSETVRRWVQIKAEFGSSFLSSSSHQNAIVLMMSSCCHYLVSSLWS